MKPNFTVEDGPTPDVCIVRIKVDSWGDIDHWFLLRSDAHHDNPASNRKMEQKHLDQVVERGAGIIDAGDLFCAMQGKWDKRSNPNDLRPEHRVANYLDALVETAAEFYMPYRDHFVVIGRGNHETAIEGRHQTQLTERLCAKLSDGKRKVRAGPYSGWVQFRFKCTSGHQQSRNLFYHHGWGGGGPVTRGTIQSNRLLSQAEADIYLSGHTHDTFNQSYVRQVLTDAGRPSLRQQEFVRPGGYKNAWVKANSWERQSGHPPKLESAWWLRFVGSAATGTRQVQIELHKAY